MLNSFKIKNRLPQTKFSFGATSAIITILGLITGLDTLAHPKLSIIGGILVVALADNISDSVGIHIYQESECLDIRETWISTFTNFLSRLLVSSTFIALVVFLPLGLSVVLSLVWGLLLLGYMSYKIAKDKQMHPFSAVVEHIAIAATVILASNYVGSFLISKFKL